jgi:hypothetical protein
LTKQNSAILPMLLAKIDCGTAIKMPPHLGFIFRYIRAKWQHCVCHANIRMTGMSQH